MKSSFKLYNGPWGNRWTTDEKKKAVYVTYFVKDNKYAKFIIGEGKRLSVLGQQI